MKWNGNIKGPLEYYKRTGTLPPSLAEAPELFEDLRPIWDAFRELSSSRMAGPNGSGPIPLSEIKAYVEVFGFMGADTVEQFFMFIRELDHTYLEETERKRDAERKKAANSKAKAGRKK